MADLEAVNLPDDLTVTDSTIFVVSDPETGVAYQVSAQELREGYFRNYVFYKNFLLSDFTFDQLNTAGTDPTVLTETNTIFNFDYYQWTTTAANAEVTFKLFDDFAPDFTPEAGYVHLNFSGGFSFVLPDGTDIELTFTLQAYTGTSGTPSDSDFTDITSRLACYYVPDQVDHELPADLLSGPIKVEAGSLPWESGNTLRGLIKVKLLAPISSFSSAVSGAARTDSQMAIRHISLELFQPVV